MLYLNYGTIEGTNVVVQVIVNDQIEIMMMIFSVMSQRLGNFRFREKSIKTPKS